MGVSGRAVGIRPGAEGRRVSKSTQHRGGGRWGWAYRNQPSTVGMGTGGGRFQPRSGETGIIIDPAPWGWALGVGVPKSTQHSGDGRWGWGFCGHAVGGGVRGRRWTCHCVLYLVYQQTTLARTTAKSAVSLWVLEVFGVWCRVITLSPPPRGGMGRTARRTASR